MYDSILRHYTCPCLIYPFVEDFRWMYWACNTCEQHRLQGQKSVYLDKNPGDANLTGEEIQEIIISCNTKTHDPNIFVPIDDARKI